MEGRVDLETTLIGYKQLNNGRLKYGVELKILVDAMKTIFCKFLKQYERYDPYITTAPEYNPAIESIKRPTVYSIHALYKIRVGREGILHQLLNFDGCDKEIEHLSIEIRYEIDQGTEKNHKFVISTIDGDSRKTIRQETPFTEIDKDEALNKCKKFLENMNIKEKEIDQTLTKIPTVECYESIMVKEINDTSFKDAGWAASHTIKQNMITLLKELDISYDSNDTKLQRYRDVNQVFSRQSIFFISNNRKWYRSLSNLQNLKIASSVPGYQNCTWLEIIVESNTSSNSKCLVRLFRDENEQEPWLYCIENVTNLEKVKTFIHALGLCSKYHASSTPTTIVYEHDIDIGHQDLSVFTDAVTTYLKTQNGHPEPIWKSCAYDYNDESRTDNGSGYFLRFVPDGNYRLKNREHENAELLITFMRFSNERTKFTKSIHFINTGTHTILEHSGPYDESTGIDSFLEEVFTKYIDVFTDPTAENESGGQSENKRKREGETVSGNPSKLMKTNMLIQIESLTNRLLKLI